MLLPSIVAPNGDRDGIPTCLIEAMYLKTPAISSKISGIPELVDDGVNGYLTDPGDSQTIADRLHDLLSDKDLRIKMGENGRTKIMSEFDVEKNLSKLIRTWEEIA
jgi:glycosyltransferase involved in cell wall biosynthesis